MFAWNVLGSAPPAKAGTITVWKSPTCGCCGEWVTYMRRKGYQVSVNLVANPEAIKANLGVPASLYSCHTAKIDDYLVEGHVPEAAIAKLLAERPNLKKASHYPVCPLDPRGWTVFPALIASSASTRTGESIVSRRSAFDNH